MRIHKIHLRLSSGFSGHHSKFYSELQFHFSYIFSVHKMLIFILSFFSIRISEQQLFCNKKYNFQEQQHV